MATITQKYELGSYVPSINLDPYDLEDIRTVLEFYIEKKSERTKHSIPSTTLAFARKLRK